MAPWEPGRRRSSWASNGNIAVYIFCALFVVWLGFQIWARIPGGIPAPTGLDPMVMAALGVAVTAKSVERRQADEDNQREQLELKKKVERLERAKRLEKRKAKDQDQDSWST